MAVLEPWFVRQQGRGRRLDDPIPDYLLLRDLYYVVPQTPSSVAHEEVFPIGRRHFAVNGSNGE